MSEFVLNGFSVGKRPHIVSLSEFRDGFGLVKDLIETPMTVSVRNLGRNIERARVVAPSVFYEIRQIAMNGDIGSVNQRMDLLRMTEIPLDESGYKGSSIYLANLAEEMTALSLRRPVVLLLHNRPVATVLSVEGHRKCKEYLRLLHKI